MTTLDRDAPVEHSALDPAGPDWVSESPQTPQEDRPVVADPSVQAGLYAMAGSLVFLAFVRLIFEAPTEILLRGAILGSLSGLVAMGIVLVYRAERVVNFAQGDLGGVSGVLMVSLLLGTGLPLAVCMFLGVAAGITTGGLVQVLLIRRFSDAPRLIVTVVTILTSTILAGIQLFVPRLFDLSSTADTLDRPLDFVEVQFGLLVFRGADFTVLVVVPLMVIALNVFFKRNRLGKAVRACAESKDRALLLGIPVKRVNLMVWIIAAAFSSIAAVLRTLIVGAPIGSVLGIGLLIPALAAAVIGRMENLWVSFGAAIAIGMVSEAVFFDTSRTAAVAPVIFGIVLIALLVQSNAKSTRADDTGVSSFSALREVRPIPPELASLPIVRFGLPAMRLPILVALFVWPLFLGTGRMVLLSYGLIYAVAALSLVILTGWTGQVSLGQFAFAGFGGALAGVMVEAGWDVLISLFCGALLGAVIAVLVGLPALRIQGLFLAVTTVTFTVACGSYFLNPNEFSWVPSGRLPRRPLLLDRYDLETEHTFYYFCLIALCCVLASMRAIRRSRAGRVLLAVRENERFTQAYGVNVVRTKLVAFAMSGFVAALAGGLLVLQQHNRITSELGAAENLRLFLVAIVGGLGSVTGVLSAVVLFQFVDYLVPSADVRLFFNGIGVLLILVLYPSGLGGIIYDLRDALLRRIALARGIFVPSLVADSLEAQAARTDALGAEDRDVTAEPLATMHVGRGDQEIT